MSNTTKQRILIVDDERDLREPMAKFLRTEGYSVSTAPDGREALRQVRSQRYEVVVTDIKMPNMNGLELLAALRAEFPLINVIIITAFGTVESAVNAMRVGAHDYVLKPVIFEDIQQKIMRLTEERTGARGGKPMRAGTAGTGIEAIKGDSEPVRQMKELILKVARAGSSALIQGPSGSGKELVARALHTESSRTKYPFVPVNCAAIPEHLLESEFFGYMKGAFTGATNNKKGLFETAHNGTLFLDEISDLTLALQAKLLRAVEERRITPIGSTTPVEIDVVLVAASAQQLRIEVKEGRFREDLYFRINVIEIFVPPLHNRREDIPMLAEYFLKEVTARLGSETKSISEETINLLIRYDWPGNIRELRNVIERAVVLSRDNTIRPEDLPEAIGDGSHVSGISSSFKSTVKGFERDLLLKTLKSCDNDKKLAAKVLGIGLSSLYRKLEEFDIE